MLQGGKEGDHQRVMNKNLEIGLDEVGKGSIFGPVFSAVVVISKEHSKILLKIGVDDSKKLSQKKRELLMPKIFQLSKDWGIGQSSAREIDTYGIRYATELSMIRAIYKLRNKPSNIYIDGSLPLRLWEGIQENHINGESKFTSIAAASIVAKVLRDRLMQRFEDKYKGYSISKNKGYGTKAHFLALKKYGLTNLHRKTFLKNLKII